MHRELVGENIGTIFSWNITLPFANLSGIDSIDEARFSVFTTARLWKCVGAC